MRAALPSCQEERTRQRRSPVRSKDVGHEGLRALAPEKDRRLATFNPSTKIGSKRLPRQRKTPPVVSRRLDQTRTLWTTTLLNHGLRTSQDAMDDAEKKMPLVATKGSRSRSAKRRIAQYVPEGRLPQNHTRPARTRSDNLIQAGPPMEFESPLQHCRGTTAS